MPISEEQLQKLVELTRKEVVDIREEGLSTVVEFADGQILPLYGGGATILDLQKDPTCSWCGVEQSDDNPLMAPLGKNDPCICAKCACRAVELFVENGVAVELDAKIPYTEGKE